MVQWKYSSTIFDLGFTWRREFQLHFPGPLIPGKGPPLPIWQKVMRAPKPDCALWRIETSIPLPRIEPVVQPVTIPPELSRFHRISTRNCLNGRFLFCAQVCTLNNYSLYKILCGTRGLHGVPSKRISTSFLTWRLYNFLRTCIKIYMWMPEYVGSWQSKELLTTRLWRMRCYVQPVYDLQVGLLCSFMVNSTIRT